MMHRIVVIVMGPGHTMLIHLRLGIMESELVVGATLGCRHRDRRLIHRRLLFGLLLRFFVCSTQSYFAFLLIHACDLRNPPSSVVRGIAGAQRRPESSPKKVVLLDMLGDVLLLNSRLPLPVEVHLPIPRLATLPMVRVPHLLALAHILQHHFL